MTEVDDLFECFDAEEEEQGTDFSNGPIVVDSEETS